MNKCEFPLQVYNNFCHKFSIKELALSNLCITAVYECLEAQYTHKPNAKTL